MAKFNRRAEWVWRPRGVSAVGFSTDTPLVAAEANRYVYFRRTFDLACVPESANVFASADGRYQLFVNGQFLGRGPARCSSSFQYIDPYDLAPYLRVGRNVIAVLAHSYGRNTSWYELPSWEHARAFGCGGFFLQGDAGDVRLDTNDAWLCLESDAWQRDAPSNSLGFMEFFDARRASIAWNEIEFDDASWARAEILRVPGRNFAGDVVPFQALVPRDIPAQREGFITPKKSWVLGQVNNRDDVRDLAERIERETIEPTPPLPSPYQGEGEGGVIASSQRPLLAMTEIMTTQDCGVVMVFDFGEIVAGRIHFDLNGESGSILDFTYGEELASDGRVLVPGGIPGFDLPPVHRYIAREGAQTWERFEWNGLRYVQITFRHCARPLHFDLSLHTTEYSIEARGQFECSDETLNKIWQTGARTLRLCMHDAYVDCPSREQRQWMDAYLDSLIGFTAFGDYALSAKMVRQMAQSQRSNGLTMMAAPGDFSLASFTNIPDFCLHWILSIGAYVQFSGDTNIVDELYPSVAKALTWFVQHLNDEDLLTDVPHWILIDWASLDKQGQVTALNSHFVAALRVAAQLARIVEWERAAQSWDALAQRVSDAVNKNLWDEARGVYVDARRNGVLSRRISQQSNAATIAFGVAPRERWARIFAVILDEQRVMLTPAGSSDDLEVQFDDEFNVVLAQPFYSHFLHRALARAGMHNAIIKNIRARWLPMLEQGDGTWWELWRLGPTLNSKCHAWSGTPTFDLSAEILGVLPIEPGFAKFRVAPHPTDLQWARGTFPTPHGDIHIEWHKHESQIELTLTVPDGTQAEIVLPNASPKIVGAGTHRI